MLKVATDNVVPMRTPGVGLLTIETVLEDWGLCDPIRDAVALILNSRNAVDPVDHLRNAVVRLRTGKGVNPTMFRRTGIDRGRDHLPSDRVARAFDLSPHLGLALWELKWAAYSEKPYEATRHLAEAENSITADVHYRRMHDGHALGWRA